MKKNKIFLYERFDNIKNLKIIKKKYRTYKITEINKFKNDLVEVLFIKLGVLLNKKELSKYVNLKFIISPTTALNHIDQDYCKENKIKIIYLDSHTKKKIKNIISTAELTITLVLLSAKKIRMTLKQAEGFYAVHTGKPFFAELTEFMSSGPCIVLALQKDNAVEAWRETIGATNPEEAAEGTIRKDYATSLGQNAVHGSDSDENANSEIGFFFSQSELIQAQ